MNRQVVVQCIIMAVLLAVAALIYYGAFVPWFFSVIR